MYLSCKHKVIIEFQKKLDKNSYLVSDFFPGVSKSRFRVLKHNKYLPQTKSIWFEGDM